jgi:hypothetical protein
MLLGIEFSMKSRIRIDLMDVKLHDYASSLCDLLQINGGRVGAITIDLNGSLRALILNLSKKLEAQIYWS